MTDFTVSRIQLRRGEHVNLPQPLDLGEVGWCLDTQRLYIGGDPSELPPAIQVFPGYYTSVQTIIDDQIVKIEVDDGLLDFEDFVTYMALYSTADHIEYTEAGAVYVALTSGQVASYATIEAYILAYDDPADDIILTVTQGLGQTLDGDGIFALATHADAGAVATLINVLSGVAVVNEKANVEIKTEYSDDFKTISLPVSGSYVDLPTPGISYVIAQSDTLLINYSIRLNDGSDYLQEVGQMEVVASVEQADAMLFQTANKMNSVGLVGEVTFQAVYVGVSSSFKIQYMSTLPATAILRYKVTNWRSY